MRDIRLVLVSAAAPVLWGTTYLATTQLLPAGRPLLAGTLRALPAGVLLVAVVAFLSGRDRRPRSAGVLPHGSWWWRAAILGTLNIGLFFALLFVAAYRLPGGIAAVLGAIGPFLVAGFAYPLLHQRPAARTLVAGAIGVGGVSLLVLRATTGLDTIGLAAATGGVVTMSLGTVLGRRWGTPPGYEHRTTAVLALTSWQLIFGGLILLGATLLLEGPPPALTGANLAGFAYLSIVGTAVAQTLWFRGVTTLAPARLTVLTLLSPLTATAIGWIVLGQSLSAGQLLGAAAVVCAVLLGSSAAAAQAQVRRRERSAVVGPLAALPARR